MATDAPRIDVRRLGKWADGCRALFDDVSGLYPVQSLMRWVPHVADGQVWTIGANSEPVGPGWYIDPDHHTTGPLLLAAVCEELGHEGIDAFFMQPVIVRGRYAYVDIGHPHDCVEVELPDEANTIDPMEALLWVADQVLPEVSDG